MVYEHAFDTCGSLGSCGNLSRVPADAPAIPPRAFPFGRCAISDCMDRGRSRGRFCRAWNCCIHFNVPQAVDPHCETVSRTDKKGCRMSTPLMLALGWLALSNVIGMFPSKHHHWPQAYVLIALGLPVLVGVFWVEGPWIGLAILFAAGSILRWPVRYLFRWLRSLVRSSTPA